MCDRRPAAVTVEEVRRLHDMTVDQLVEIIQAQAEQIRILDGALRQVGAVVSTGSGTCGLLSND